MEAEFEEANSNNLPTVSLDMIHDFYISNLDYMSPEIKGVKTLRSTRECYGDNAIGYVQVKRQDGICYLFSRVTPEHRISKKAYKCKIEIDEINNEVIVCKCEDCAAAEGGCKHAIAFLYWLHRRSEEPSPTEIKSYWQKPKLGDPKYRMVKCKDFPGSAPIPDNLTTSFLEKVVNEGPPDADIQLLRYYKGTKTLTDQGSIYHLLLDYNESLSANEVPSADNFINFCRQHVKQETITQIYLKTKDQSSSSLWHEIRYARVTASNLYDVSRCHTPEGALCNMLLGASSPFETSATKRGKLLEASVLKVVAQKKNIKFANAGIQLNSDLPIFGASPDGVSQEYVVEIKCPTKESRIKNYVSKNKITNRYKTQIIMQMHMCNKKKGLFCVASPNFETNREVQILEINYDENFIKKILEDAEEFWKKHIFPLLLTDL